MATFAVWIGALVIPASGFLANVVLRFRTGVVTTGADWLLLLWVFDLGAVVAHRDFQKLVAPPDLAANTPMTFAGLTAAALVTWLIVVVCLEPRLVTSAAQTPRGWKARTSIVFWWGFSWTLVILLTGMHALVFLLR